MSVKVENLEKNMAKLTVEVSEDVFEKAVQDVYMKQRGKISIPGFRKGKAPRKMIEKMYGAGVFYEDAANKILPTEYSKAADESGLEIVSQPDIEVVQIEAGKPFIFTATVATKPEVELGQYLEIEVAKQDMEVTEEEILAEIDKERENNSRVIDVDDRPVADKDIAVIDFDGSVDGVPFDGGKGEDYELTIGSHTFIEGFEEQVIGMNIDEEKDVNVTFPEDYHAENLAGKPAVFKVKVKQIKVKELPELDDDFAQDVSEFNTLDEYKADVKAKLADMKEKTAKRAKENEVIEKIIENAKMEVPDAMVETQAGYLVDDFARRISSQGLSIEQYMQFTGLTQEKMLEQMKPEALKRIQTRLVLEAIAKAENIEISDERVDEEVKNMAEQYKMEFDKLKEMMQDSEKEEIKNDLAVTEAVKIITESAKEI